MDSKKRSKDPTNYFELAQIAMREAYVKLVREKRKKGESLILWKDGKVCDVPADQIELPEDANSSGDSR